MSRIGKPVETESRLVVDQSRGEGGWGVTAPGYWVFLEGGDKHVLKLW